MITKRVEYSYFSSPNATRFGFARTGCYTVELIPQNPVRPGKAVAGFADLESARAHAETLPEPWDRLTK